MDKLLTPARAWLRRLAMLPALLLWFAAAGAWAQAQEVDPPGRVAALSHAEGSVVFAPEGEDEWIDLPVNRPLTRGDRVWTDRGARAQLHMGATVLHLDGEAHLAFFELDDDAAQLSLTQGSVNLRVRELAPRENMEVDTPNLAVRALQPGDYRVDVDAERGVTRVAVRSGQVIVYGENGESLRLAAGQQASFTGRDLEQVRALIAGTDAFDQWAGELNRREDQSVSARYVPRHVIGYQQLDQYGTWSQAADYGYVWYPRVTVDNWAPYRYGRWTYIRPWGWTWIDDAPWGFAPSHYGRWAMIGSRWAWVPAHLGTRPVYSPAVVAFVGGGSGVSVSINIGSGPGIGWYPLAPGEAWWPTYRTSTRYVTRVNPSIVINNVTHVHVHRTRADAFTAMRVNDFNRGLPVRDHWRAVRSQDIANAPVTRELPRPERERGFERAFSNNAGRARLATTPPSTQQPAAPGRTFAPGLAGTAPGHGGTPPGLSGTAPGRAFERREVQQERREEKREDKREDKREAREERLQQREQPRFVRPAAPQPPQPQQQAAPQPRSAPVPQPGMAPQAVQQVQPKKQEVQTRQVQPVQQAQQPAGLAPRAAPAAQKAEDHPGRGKAEGREEEKKTPPGQRRFQRD
jgi:hypothetical protein